MTSSKPEGELPDTGCWQPQDASQSLASALEKECFHAEERILQGLLAEKNLAVNNFDSGLPFEAILRRELKQFLPKRYSVSTGLLLDRFGRTSGKCDVVLHNDTWFSPVKASAAEGGGTPYIPIESVYAVGEVKQSLSVHSLDNAMEKLVTTHRLTRPKTFAHRVVENREGAECAHGLTNPLFSFIFAGGMSKNCSLQSIMERLFDINKQLKRLEVVRYLSVMGGGAVFWGFKDPLNNYEIRPALFVEADLFHPIFPIYVPSSNRNTFYGLVEHVQRDLFETVLGPEDIAFAYSYLNKTVCIPKCSDVSLPPDLEWASLLERPCNHQR